MKFRFVSQVVECYNEGMDYDSIVLLNIYLGIAWILGCLMFGLIVVQKNQECRVSKQYLCQVNIFVETKNL